MVRELQLLQGFAGPRARKDIVQRFIALPLLVPDRQDAAGIRNVKALALHLRAVHGID